MKEIFDNMKDYDVLLVKKGVGSSDYKRQVKFNLNEFYSLIKKKLLDDIYIESNSGLQLPYLKDREDNNGQ